MTDTKKILPIHNLTLLCGEVSDIKEHTKDTFSVVNAKLKVNTGRTLDNGDIATNTFFISISNKKNIETFKNNYKNGDIITIQGSLRNRMYQQDNTKKYFTQIEVTQFDHFYKDEEEQERDTPPFNF